MSLKLLLICVNELYYDYNLIIYQNNQYLLSPKLVLTLPYIFEFKLYSTSANSLSSNCKFKSSTILIKSRSSSCNTFFRFSIRFGSFYRCNLSKF